MGVCEHEANLEGRPLAELSDSDLECVGEVSRLSEGSQVRVDGWLVARVHAGRGERSTFVPK